MVADTRFDVSEDFYGAFWLNSIPSDWNLVPAWALMRERGEKSREDDIHLTPSQAYGVISQEEYMAITGSKVVLNLTGANNMKHVEPGDFIIHLRSFQGGLEYSAITGKVSNAYTVLKPVVDMDDGYYKWLFKSSAFISALAGSTDQLRDGQSINFKKFSTFSVPFPPLEAQRRIADFLDKEISEIDTLVGELDEFIELLVKSRSSIISEELRKSNSGVFFPLVSLNLVVGVSDGLVDPLDENFSDLPLIAPNHIEKNLGRLIHPIESAKEQGAISGKGYVRAGQVVYSKIRPALNKVAIAEKDSLCSADMYPLEILGNLTEQYLLYALLDKRFVDSAVLESSRVAMPKVNRETLGMLKIPLPSLEEQKRIVHEIQTEMTQIDCLIDECTELKEILLKRRQVLITDVVTGKVEV
ncbi:restriction endonuclease subunit S [Corynebacterium pyruviciproducens]|nr:restriction endonuclease subunit S [Corynebacterium pyruviciproducens]